MLKALEEGMVIMSHLLENINNKQKLKKRTKRKFWSSKVQ